MLPLDGKWKKNLTLCPSHMLYWPAHPPKGWMLITIVNKQIYVYIQCFFYQNTFDCIVIVVELLYCCGLIIIHSFIFNKMTYVKHIILQHKSFFIYIMFTLHCLCVLLPLSVDQQCSWNDCREWVLSHPRLPAHANKAVTHSWKRCSSVLIVIKKTPQATFNFVPAC